MDSIELEQSSGLHKPVADARPLIPDPPPVRLIAIDDVHLPAASGFEHELDAFYVGLLLFVRKSIDEQAGNLFYYAENHRLCFDVLEPPIFRDSVRPVGIEIPSMADVEQKLIDEQVPYTRQVGLAPGDDSMLLQDPAGNWVLLSEMRVVF